LLEVVLVGLDGLKKRFEWTHVIGVQVHAKVIEGVFNSFEAVPQLLEVLLDQLDVGAGRQFEMLQPHHYLERLLLDLVALVVYLSFIHFCEGVLSIR
jgi:hypothetical protein